VSTVLRVKETLFGFYCKTSMTKNCACGSGGLWFKKKSFKGGRGCSRGGGRGCSRGGGCGRNRGGGCGCTAGRLPFKGGKKRISQKKASNKKRRKTFRGGHFEQPPTIETTSYTYPFNTASGGSLDPSSPINTESTHLS